ncbi:hypothetical protein [Streptomyces sp. NPDC001678]|uniref:Rv1733c family protein n=1 Tax=Streptomyces sp. NPDC001678 TaxID=3364599 RepID=UPI0036BB78B7
MTTDRTPSPRRAFLPIARRRAVLPPRRPCDRHESRVRVVLLLLLVPALVCVPCLAARTVYEAEMRTVREESAARHRVTAWSAGDVSEAGSGSGTRWSPVHWTGDRGTPRTGFADVPTGTARGEPVGIWVDAEGEPTRAPMRRQDALETAGFTGAMTAVTLILGFLGARTGVTTVFDRRRYAHWAAEWEVVEPQWSKRLPT